MERFIATMRRLVEALREADTFSTAEVEAMINAKDRGEPPWPMMLPSPIMKI
jgi:hypothetical protein